MNLIKFDTHINFSATKRKTHLPLNVFVCFFVICKTTAIKVKENHFLVERQKTIAFSRSTFRTEVERSLIVCMLFVPQSYQCRMNSGRYPAIEHSNSDIVSRKCGRKVKGTKLFYYHLRMLQRT